MAFQAAQAEEGRVTQRNGHYGCGKIFFISVLVQSHFGIAPIEIDEAGFGWMGIV